MVKTRRNLSNIKLNNTQKITLSSKGGKLADQPPKEAQGTTRRER